MTHATTGTPLTSVFRHTGTAATNGRGVRSLDHVEARERAASLEAGTDAQAVLALVDRAKTGDADAFGTLYDRFQPEILRYLVIRVRDQHHAEDLAQQVFLKAWQAIPRYEHRGVPFRAWLYRMAHNQMVDFFRTSRPTADLEGFDLPDDNHTLEAILLGEVQHTVQRALGRLSEDHRRVLILRFQMDKSAREIGEIMGRKEVTVRGLQMRALQALKRELEEEKDDLL